MAFLLDALLIMGILTFLLGLTLSGSISPEMAGVALLALVVVMAFARARGLTVAGTVLRIALPIASLFALARYSGGSVGQLLSAMLPLVVALVGFYVMVRGVFGYPKH